MSAIEHRAGDFDQEQATKKATTVMVKACLLDSVPWVGFSMIADYKDKGGRQKGETLEFDVNAGPFDLSFELDDQSGLKLDFYPTFAESMWVAVGELCPLGPGNGEGAITDGKKDEKKNKKIIMTNGNSDSQTLTFMLRFSGNVKDAAHPPYEYDPKIINGANPPLFEVEDDGPHEEED